MSRRVTPASASSGRGARRSRDGFTLVEVIVAMAVVAVAFTALLGLHVRSLRLAAREQAYSQALLLARTLVTDAELLGESPEVGISVGDFEERFPGSYPGFVWEQEVSPTPFPDTREVTIRVLPPDPAAAAELTLYLRGGST